MGNTEIVAWWGAIVATLVLLWDVLKWMRLGPKIKKRIVLNAHYDDGKIISEEETGNGKITTYEEYCHIELTNIGTIPTTIMSISATHKANKSKIQRGVIQQAFTEHFGMKLPHVISPGEIWSCRLPMSHYQSILKNGTPEIHVGLSHLNQPLVVRATKAANKALQPMPKSGTAEL